MKPVYKIEVYDSNDSLLYTITDDVLQLHVKDVLTHNIGSFHFTLPTKKNGSKYYYNDIAVHDKVKIWLGYDSFDTDPIFVGRIQKIHAPLSTQQGYIRRFSGSSLGEILKRRIKSYDYYDGEEASSIVTEWANDLGLGTSEIESDTSTVTMEVRNESYFSLLQKISDYWVSADTQIKKDFYVDINNNLVWKSRPIRSSNVETLTLGENILAYDVTRDITSVKNSITVYGATEMLNPSDGDAWTESTDGWILDHGENFFATTDHVKAGSYHIRVTGTGDGDIRAVIRRAVSGLLPFTFTTLHFWFYSSGSDINSKKVRLWAPDSNNYFEADIKYDVASGYGNWDENEISLGPSEEAINPYGPWSKIGNPSWFNIQYIQFYVSWSTTEFFGLDGLFFGKGRYYKTVEDATSKTNYGTRQYVMIDDALHSNSECQKRAETLLYQLKDPVTRIDVTVVGNTNIKIGDRLSLTIPAENISNASYDVVAVEHFFSKDQGFITTASMVNTAERRELPAKNIHEHLILKYRDLNKVAKGLQIIK